jgi:hypothetical protein
MKKSILKTALFVSVLSVIAGCQTTSTVYKPVEVTEVVNIPGQSQEEIYNKTRQWFSQYFVSGESVVDYEDPKAGTIIGNGIADNGTDFMGIIRYSFKYNVRIDTKDGRFRAITKIVEHTNTDTSKSYTASYVTDERSAAAEQKVKEIVSNIESYVTSERHDSKSSW